MTSEAGAKIELPQRIREMALDVMFGPDSPDCVEDWATIELLAPGTVARLPGDMQEMLLQHCLLKLQDHPSWSCIRESITEPCPCDVHKLWAQLLTSIPVFWTDTGFLEVAVRPSYDGFEWLEPNYESTRLYWFLLVEMGGCCEAERGAVIRSMEKRKAPLNAMLRDVILREDDDFYPGEKELMWYFLERAPTRTIRKVHIQLSCGSGWTYRKCARRAERILRWRGLRAAWISAVMRAA